MLDHLAPIRRRHLVLGESSFDLTDWATFGVVNPTQPDRMTVTGLAGASKEMLEIGRTYRVEVEGTCSNAGIFLANSTSELNNLQSFDAGNFSLIFNFVAITTRFAIGQLMGIANLIIITKLRITRLL